MLAGAGCRRLVSPLISGGVILTGKLRNQELHNLSSSADVIRMIKSKRLRWAGHVARMGEESI
jgi:hypothetical protein